MISLWNIPTLKPEMEFQLNLYFGKFIDPMNHWYQTAGQSMTVAWDMYHEMHQLAHEYGFFERHREFLAECLSCSFI